MTDLTRYLVDSATAPNLWWLYKFPNGRSAFVTLDPHQPLRFEIEIDGSGRAAYAGLTGEEVEANLTELAASAPEGE